MYEDHKFYYLILDLVSGGEMFDHLINYGAYSEADAARLMFEIASALAFMHGVDVVYVFVSPYCSSTIWPRLTHALLCARPQPRGFETRKFALEHQKSVGWDH
jgi:hypothetical protein